MHHFLVVLMMGLGEKGEFDAHVLDSLFVDEMEPLCHLIRGATLFLSADGDGGAVLIRPRNHHHAVPLQALITVEDVWRQQRAGQVAQMYDAIGIGPRHSDEYLGHLNHLK